MPTTLLNRPKQTKFDKAVQLFLYRHPRAAFFILFICMPIFILLAVFICAGAVILPIAWIMGGI